MSAAIDDVTERAARGDGYDDALFKSPPEQEDCPVCLNVCLILGQLSTKLAVEEFCVLGVIKVTLKQVAMDQPTSNHLAVYCVVWQAQFLRKRLSKGSRNAWIAMIQ